MRAVYAFVAWIVTIAVYLIFLTWALLPEDILHSFGITYYPSKNYAIILPTYSIIFYVFVSLAYLSVNMINTKDPVLITTLRNSNARRAPATFVRCGLKEGIPDIGDIDPLHISYLMAISNFQREN